MKCKCEWCKKEAVCKSYCQRHYEQMHLIGFTYLTYYDFTPEQQFWFMVDIKGPKDCWKWLGTVNDAGYGQASIKGVFGYAHRYSYMLVKGPIPDNKDLCHTCDFTTCVNPDHLFPCTKPENNFDKVMKGRQAKGSKNSGAKINETEIEHIRGLKTAGWSVKQLAVEFGLHVTTIRQIINRDTWKHVD